MFEVEDRIRFLLLAGVAASMTAAPFNIVPSECRDLGNLRTIRVCVEF